MPRYVFGPVPSRRLGASLGINNIPPKVCSYSCVYCQLGRTITMSVERRRYSDPNEIAREVREVASRGVRIDYVTFVPDGEPTLDTEIGRAAALIGSMGLRTAIITNSSLMWRDDVRADLSEFSLVSLKVDAVDEQLWRRINRPHRSLSLDRVLEGCEEFAKGYRGALITETMLVKGLNTCEECLKATALFVARLRPAKAYIAVPIRPPAEPWVEPPSGEDVVRAYTVFSEVLSGDRVELLTGPEPPRFEVVGEPEDYLLRTTSVHPMRLSHALKALEGLVEDPEAVVKRLVRRGELVVVTYRGEKFLVRSFVRRGSS